METQQSCAHVESTDKIILHVAKHYITIQLTECKLNSRCGHTNTKGCGRTNACTSHFRAQCRHGSLDKRFHIVPVHWKALCYLIQVV